MDGYAHVWPDGSQTQCRYARAVAWTVTLDRAQPVKRGDLIMYLEPVMGSYHRLLADVNETAPDRQLVVQTHLRLLHLATCALATAKYLEGVLAAWPAP